MNDQIMLEPDEKPVEEVRCSETGVPLPAIPAWYATVNVKFVSNAARKSTNAFGLLSPEAEAARLSGLAEGEAEPALEELEIDEIDVDEVEVEADEE